MATYSISDLSELTGVKTHTLRIWEKRYGLLNPQRTDTNIRFYDDHDLKKLRMIKQLTSNGVRISTIAEMSPEEMEAECKRITLRYEDYESRLTDVLLSFDMTRLDEIIESSIRHYGFESTLLSLLLPFLQKMESLWLSGQIGEAHEACFRELVNRKVLREIETIPQNCSGPRVIMFLPKGNHETLNHHVMHYFLRREGLCITDVGCGINLECATSAIKNCQADCLLMVNTDHAHWQFGSFVKELSKIADLPIIISGRAAEEELHDMSGKIIILDTIEETIQFAARLKENIQQ